jgi:hypothetical protein
MTTLKITSRDRPGIQKIEIPARDAVLIAPDGSGTVDMAATGANVLVRFGSPAADARDFIVVHDGDHRRVKLVAPAYALAFHDRPLDDN